ncbi:hypothetical protein CHUAL_005627 [Chamberlinius hualienensis]
MASRKLSTRVSTSEQTCVIDCVQLDSLAVLKIVKHCHEEGAGTTDVAQGVLLGLVVDNQLEVTNCFPFPRHSEDEDFDEMEYQMEMMRHLRQVNIDHLHVGWYQSTYYGGFLNKALLDSQFSYQSSIEESVVLIYDPLKTSRGFLSIKAYRLSPVAMQMYKDGDFTTDSVKTNKLSFENMFDEIPVVIKTSQLCNALLCELSEMIPEHQGNQYLDLGTATGFVKSMRSLMDSVEELTQETNKVLNHQRQVVKQQQAKQQFLQKRAQENAARLSRGEPPLPEDEVNKLFKPIPPPGRLDSLLLSGQISSYCNQISQFSTQSIGKLFVAEALQPNKAP